MALYRTMGTPGDGDDDCSWNDFNCRIGDAVQGAGEKFFSWMVERSVDGITVMLEVMGTAWFDWPSPTLTHGAEEIWDSSTLAPALASMQGNLSYAVWIIACLSFLIAVIRMVWTLRAQEAQTIARMFIILSASTLTAASIVQILLRAGDQFSPWLIQQAAGEDFEATSFQAMIFAYSPNMGQSAIAMIMVALVLSVLMILGTIAQTAFMILRAPLILTMMVFLPLLAAGTATEEGFQRFKKACAFLLAMVLYKPVAAIIYATGIIIMRTSDDAAGIDQILNLIYGFIIVSLAALALPAMIKFFVPAAAVGSSNVFSGGAAALGAGAVVVGGAMLMGAGGAGAAAGAARGGAGAAAAPPVTGGGGSAGAAGQVGRGLGGGGGGSGSGAPAPMSGGQGPSGGAGGATAPAAAAGGGGASPGSGSLPASPQLAGGASPQTGGSSTTAAAPGATDGGASPGAGTAGGSLPAGVSGSAAGSAGPGASGGPSGAGGQASSTGSTVPASAGQFPSAGHRRNTPAAPTSPTEAPLVTSEGMVMGAHPGPQHGAGGGRGRGARVIGNATASAVRHTTNGAGMSTNEHETTGANPVPPRMG